MPPAATKSDVDTPTATTSTTDAAGQLNALRTRIRAGLNKDAGVDPSEKAPTCRACYQRGWMAALKSLRED